MTNSESSAFNLYRLTTVCEPCRRYMPGRAVRNGGDVAGLVIDLIRDDPREHFVAVYLNAKHRMLGMHVVSIGHARASIVHPRHVFHPAFLLNASAIVVAHNHPSGDPSPSADDLKVTERLTEAGALLGIELLDHVVLGHGRYYSFADERIHPALDPVNLGGES